MIIHPVATETQPLLHEQPEQEGSHLKFTRANLIRIASGVTVAYASILGGITLMNNPTYYPLGCSLLLAGTVGGGCGALLPSKKTRQIAILSILLGVVSYTNFHIMETWPAGKVIVSIFNYLCVTSFVGAVSFPPHSDLCSLGERQVSQV